jgi:hypothetical protein
VIGITRAGAREMELTFSAFTARHQNCPEDYSPAFTASCSITAMFWINSGGKP